MIFEILRKDTELPNKSVCMKHWFSRLWSFWRLSFEYQVWNLHVCVNCCWELNENSVNFSIQTCCFVPCRQIFLSYLIQLILIRPVLRTPHSSVPFFGHAAGPRCLVLQWGAQSWTQHCGLPRAECSGTITSLWWTGIGQPVLLWDQGNFYKRVILSSHHLPIAVGGKNCTALVLRLWEIVSASH